MKLYFLILALVSFNLFAQNLESPRETMRSFIEAMDRVKDGDLSAIKDAVETLDLSEIDMGSRQTIGKITAERLINTIDRISKINYENVPNYRTGPTWYFRKQSITISGNSHDVEIAIFNSKEGWKFTPQTVSSVEDYYNSVERLKVVDGVVALSSWKTNF